MNRYESFVGKVLDGRYKILELVGMGGMACVLKAMDLVMNRIVAIKILNDEYNGNEAAEARFIDESKAVAMLSHKNIVSVYDVAIYPDIKYIVMEFLDGITLREYLDNKGALPWKEACIYVLQILRALEHAHGKGVVHRDIKPQNVMLLRNGDIKVTDFGIAKLPNAEVQKNEKAIGTVYYISPEQACGKETDYYSDIYSVGIMFYEAVTGSLPFVAETPMEVAMMQVNDEPVNPRDLVLSIPVGVSQIILKSIEKSPSDRFASAHSMAKAIEWVLRNPDVIFSMTATGADEGPVGKTSVVSIDMIDTAEIQPYGEDEIADSLGKKKRDRAKASDETEKKDKNKKAKKKKTSRSMFPVIAGVTFSFLIVAVVLGATIGINLINNLLDKNTDTEVIFPDIVGKIYSSELESKLNNKEYGARFSIKEIINVEDDSLANGTIVKTDPVAGHTARADDSGIVYFDSITVNISQKVIVPDIAGLPKSVALTTLSNLKLTVEFQEDSSTENPYYYDDQVTKTYPAARDECTVGDTIIVYVYTRGETVNTGKMPNCIGMTKDTAIKYTQTYALYTVIITEIPTPGGDGRVTAQSISEGTISPKGTEVTLTLAVPLTTVADLSGLTYQEAITASGIDSIVGSISYFKANPVSEEGVFIIGKSNTDISQCSQQLLNIGCLPASSADDTGNGVIVFQSVAPMTELAADTKVDIIIVVFSDTVPLDQGA